MRISYLMFIFLLTGFENVYGQDSNCQVNMKSISGSYTGGCKKGLAHGSGRAEGLDSYQGGFKKGLPHGEGVYVWRSGKKFEGKFEKGLMYGKGVITQPIADADSILSGYWRKDVYIGKVFLPDVGIVSRRNVDRIEIEEYPGQSAEIRFRFLKMGVKNGEISDLTVTTPTGLQQVSSGEVIIDNPEFPFNTIITYRTPNKFSTAMLDVRVQLEVNFRGIWVITLYN
jgi:hypothetical protein